MTLKKSSASSLYSCLIPGFSVDGSHNHNNESDESEFVAKFSTNPSTTMSKSTTTHCTAPTLLMNELSVEGGDDTYGNGRRDTSNYSLSSSSNASPTDHWNNSFANFNITPHSSPSQSPSRSQSSPYNYQTAAEHHSSSSLSSSSSFLRRTYLEEQQQQEETVSIETPIHMKAYVTRDQEEQQYEQNYDQEHVYEQQMMMKKMMSSAISKRSQQQQQQQQQHTHPHHNLQPYVVSSSSQHQQQQQHYQKQVQPKQQKQQQQQRQVQRLQPRTITYNQKQKPIAVNVNHRQTSHRLPRITQAATPFEKTIAPTSYLHDELSKDDAYRHAMRCGVVWQSLVGQSVKFPALWYDGQVDDPHPRPFLGCPSKSNKWSFFGRHRMKVGQSQPGIANTNTMNSLLRTLVRDCNSSGKLLLHIIVRDSTTFEPTEDIVVGVYHPNAKGIRPTSSPSGTSSINVAESQLVDQCRDIWIGHRSRSIPQHGKRQATRIESLLHYLNKQSVDKSPLGKNQNRPTTTTAEGGGGTASSIIIPYRVDNTNMNAIYGRTPPKSTVFVPEHKLYQLLSPPSQQPPSQRQPPQKPASLVLLKLFLQ